jgi:hypothetical protein
MSLVEANRSLKQYTSLPGVKRPRRKARRLKPACREWEALLGALEDFRKEQGHCAVPARWPDHPRLSQWVLWLRRARKRGLLRREHIEQLDALGFLWRGKDAWWERMFAGLKDYQREHGDCHISTLSREYTSLARWIRTQREKKRRGKLSAARIQRLEAIGFVWDWWQAHWDQMLAEYKAVYGHCDVPVKSDEHPQLGSWVMTQRAKFRSGRLSQARVERLNALRFTWRMKPERAAP